MSRQTRSDLAYALSQTHVLLLILCMITTALFSGCDSNYIIKKEVEIVSPDHRWKAVSFARLCAVPSPKCHTVTGVSVLAATQVFPDREADVLSLDDGGSNLSGNGQHIEVKLKWQRNNLLVVWYPGPARILRQKNKIGAIRIQF